MNRSILILSIVLLSQTQAANEMSDRRLAELLQPTSAVEMLPGYPKAFAEPRAILPGWRTAKFQGQPPRPGYLAALRVLPHNPAEPATAGDLSVHSAGSGLHLAADRGGDRLPHRAKRTGPGADSGPAHVRPGSAQRCHAGGEHCRRAPQRHSVAGPGSAVAPMNLPDPFELQGYIRLPNPLAEDFQPMAVPPRVLLKPNEPVKK